MRPTLHHPMAIPDLVEAWILDRLGVAPTGDRDRPSLRFLTDAAEAAETAESLHDALPAEVRAVADGAAPGDAVRGAVLSFDRSVLASALTLLSVYETRGDLGEDEREMRARTDLVGLKARIQTIALSDEEIDAWIAAYAKGHPQDDGTGRLTRAARDALDELYADPRRIPPDPDASPARR